MIFELLPNEILLDVMSYLNGVDIFRAFYGLNTRFNALLYQQCRNFYMDFKSVSKRDFDVICQKHLPLIADQLISLSLWDSPDTPEQISFFLSYVPSFNQLIQLRSLTLNNVLAEITVRKILNKCQHLRNLTH